MIYIFFYTEEHKDIIRKELICRSVTTSDIDKLIINQYYKLSKGEIIKISSEDYYFLRSMRYAVPLLPGGFTGGVIAYYSNKELNLNNYNDKNERYSYRTGQGYSFEDLNNNAFKKAGYKVDSKIGKKHTKGGPDAIIIDKNGNSFQIQYKCCKKAKYAAKCIAKRNGYQGQLLYVNPEIESDLKKILIQMESEGKVPAGTSERVIASCITYSEADNVCRFGTKESLFFDAEQALPTGLIAFAVTGLLSLYYNAKKEGEINKNVVKKTFKIACLSGFLAFIGHVGYNQYKRL